MKQYSRFGPFYLLNFEGSKTFRNLAVLPSSDEKRQAVWASETSFSFKSMKTEEVQENKIISLSRRQLSELYRRMGCVLVRRG